MGRQCRALRSGKLRLRLLGLGRLILIGLLSMNSGSEKECNDDCQQMAHRPSVFLLSKRKRELYVHEAFWWSSAWSVQGEGRRR